MNTILPSFLQSDTSNDLVGFNLLATSETSDQGIVTFGQEFKEGALKDGQALAAKFGNSETPVQVDVKNFYLDGSVRYAVLSLQQPNFQNIDALQGMLFSTSDIPSNTPISISNLIGQHDMKVSLSFDDGSNQLIDAGQAVAAAIANGSAETWLSGPLVSQARVSVSVRGSLRLLVTLTAYNAGGFALNVGFNNDIAMSSTGGEQNYSAKILLNGQIAFEQDSIKQAQYQDWNSTVWGGSAQKPTTIVQHDTAYLESFGSIPNFDLGNGSDPGKISYYQSTIDQPGWNSPLSNNDVLQLMPTAGGRPDIGITTEANAVWLITQDPTAQAYVLGQANASGAVPWNFWNSAAGTWLNTDQYSNVWTDNRGGTSDHGSIGLTQLVSDNTGWNADTSHQPDLSYNAFLMTGDERYLDSLNAQASFAITNTWEAYRGDQQLVVGYDQVRASAWNLREIDQASWANPKSSIEGQYFAKISNANWSWLVSQIPNWTAKQGEAYGQVEGYAWGSRSYSRPWMQDYFASVASEAARHGNADALTFLKWESNFLIGRFLNGDNGFNPHDGIAYTLAMGPDASDGNVRYTTWADIGKATVAANESNGDGFSNSIGDYGMLGLVTVSDIISLTGSTDAIKAYNFLITSGAPFTTAADRAVNNQFNIIPNLPTGWTFAADGSIVQSNGPTTGPSVPSTPVAPTPTPSPLPTPTPGAGSDTVVVNASASLANGVGAHFNLVVDGVTIGDATVSSTTTQAYSFNTTLAGGSSAAHNIKVLFDNDAVINGQDRNLYLQSISVNGQTTAATDSHEVYHATGSASTGFGPGDLASNGSMLWQGTAEFNLPAVLR